MPANLSTTIGSISSIPNPVNSTLVYDFYQYMKSIGTSENYQNVNLKIMIYFSRFLGSTTAYYVDKINLKSFVSHANVENREELEYIDLIRDMKDRLFLIPELAPIFMQREDVLVEILSTLVRLADGEGLLTHSSLHGLRGVDDKLMFSMLGATVEIPSRVYKVLSSLGPKLYFYRINFKEPAEATVFRPTKSRRIHNGTNNKTHYLKGYKVNHFWIWNVD